MLLESKSEEYLLMQPKNSEPVALWWRASVSAPLLPFLRSIALCGHRSACVSGLHQFLFWCRVPKKAQAAGSEGVASSAAVEKLSTELERPPPGSKPVAVLYGTEYGFSKEIAEKAAAQLKETGTYW